MFCQDIFHLYLILLTQSWIICFSIILLPMLSFIEKLSTSFFMASWSFIMDIKSSCAIASSWSSFMFLGFLNCLVFLAFPVKITDRNVPQLIWIATEEIFLSAWAVLSENVDKTKLSGTWLQQRMEGNCGIPWWLK